MYTRGSEYDQLTIKIYKNHILIINCVLVHSQKCAKCNPTPVDNTKEKKNMYSRAYNKEEEKSQIGMQLLNVYFRM